MSTYSIFDGVQIASSICSEVKADIQTLLGLGSTLDGIATSDTVKGCQEPGNGTVMTDGIITATSTNCSFIRPEEKLPTEARVLNSLQTLFSRPPHLAVIIVGDRKDSIAYVSRKVKACHDCGIQSTVLRKPETITEPELKEVIRELNTDENVDGLLLQVRFGSDRSGA